MASLPRYGTDNESAPFVAAALTRQSSIIRFGEITIDEFPPILGDNPAVSDGAPIGLSPVRQRSQTVDVDLYERLRARSRRAGDALLMDKHEREQVLLSAGYKQAEIDAAGRESQRLRAGREHSIDKMKWDGFNEKLEMTTRKLKKMVSLGGRSEKDKHVWNGLLREKPSSLSSRVPSKSDSSLPPTTSTKLPRSTATSATPKRGATSDLLHEYGERTNSTMSIATDLSQSSHHNTTHLIEL